MPLTTEVRNAVTLLERLQGSLRASDDPKMDVQCTNDLNTIISVLHNPVFNRIVTIKDSLHDLKAQLANHPSLVPSDFEISTRRGDLLLRSYSEEYPQTITPSEVFDDNQIAVSESLVQLEEADNQRESEHSSPQHQWINNGIGGSTSDSNNLLDKEVDEIEALSQSASDEELKKLIISAAQGREIHHIQLYKPEGASLGFSVVGLKSEQRGNLGIYLQEIQPTGIAAKDGRLHDGDQILAIDGQVLDSDISYQQAISILQKANKLVDLVVARAPLSSEKLQLSPDPLEQEKLKQKKLEEALAREQEYLISHNIIVPPCKESRTSNMLNTEWAQVEVIHLVNDGSGLGFGIIGGKSTGVVVKTILPGGVADREGRLQPGDHILQIGEVNLRGMGSDQVATVLRKAGMHVRLVVARPVESISPDIQSGYNAPIIETRVLNDPEELDRHLSLIANGHTSNIAMSKVRTPLNGDFGSSSTSSASTVPAGTTNGHTEFFNGDHELLTVNNQIASTSATVAILASDGHLPSNISLITTDHLLQHEEEEEEEEEEDENVAVAEGGEGMSLADLPEMENILLELAKDQQGLGITIAGYVCEREELSGIFVKSINVASAADRSGQIQVNDQIIQVDGVNLCGLSNHAAVEVLRSTGHVVRLRLARYLRGPKFEQLQQAIANSELKTTPTTPNPPRAYLSDLPSSEAIKIALVKLEDDPERLSHEGLPEAYNTSVTPYGPPPHTSVTTLGPPQHTSVTPLGPPQHTSVINVNEAFHQPKNFAPDLYQGSQFSNDVRLDDIELLIDTDYGGELQTSVLSAIVRKWSRNVDADMEIVVAQLHKFERGGGLGISLEGTVDVEDGQEVRPHHYIRSILQDGPVGRDGRLKSGDELLEVNNQKLLGLNHVEVVTILKELPQAVRIVCGRRLSGPILLQSDDDTLASAIGSKNGLSGSLQNLNPSCERLVKAKSDGSLASSTAANISPDNSSLAKVKSRSLEPLTGLAMWSSEPQNIELVKGDRGLGFSILDYQDPLNPQDTVIVIRSLVPGGIAEKDGRIIPGDRLVGVNGASLEGASLDEAVGALKGAPKGPVMICVAKPISVLESPGQLDMILGDLGSSDVGSDVLMVEEDYEESSNQRLEENSRRRNANDSVLSTASSGPPSLPTTEPPCLDREQETPVLMVPVATERLIGGSNSSSTTTSSGAGINRSGSGRKEKPLLEATPRVICVSSSASNVVVANSGDEEIHSDESQIMTALHPLPKNLQRTCRIRKATDQLGINIEVVDQGLNGVVVSSLVRGGAVHKDNRIHAGDLIVSVNNESMRNITNSQARAILRRTQLVSSDVNISYIPGKEAAKYRDDVLRSYKSVHESDQISQRSSYMKEENLDPDLLGDLTRSSTAPSFVTRQLRENSHENLIQVPNEPAHLESGRPSSALSDVSGAAATVVTLKNAISEVLGTDELPKSRQRNEENEEGPFTITFRNISEAGVLRPDVDQASRHTPDSMTVDSRNTALPLIDRKHWGPERTVEVCRDENGSLGISIVGGKVDLSWSGSSVTGIFVKNVLPNSPAGKSGLLKTGDRILVVENVDLRTATHEKAVEVIKKTRNPVTFIVQSLVQWTPSNNTASMRDVNRNGSEVVLPVRTPTPELIQVSSMGHPLGTSSVTTSSCAIFTTAVCSTKDNILTYSSEHIQQATLSRAESIYKGMLQRPRGSLTRSTSEGGDSLILDDDDDSLSYTLYAYEDGVPTRSTTLIHHPSPTPPASSSIKHYYTLPPKRRPQHTIASAFTVVLKGKQSEKAPNASTPVNEPEPINFTTESPIDDPDDALYTPYYYYAKAALAFWHSKAVTKEEFGSSVQQLSPNCRDKSNSSSDTSVDQEASDSLIYRHGKGTTCYIVGGRSSGSAGASPEETASDVTTNDTSLLESEPRGKSFLCIKKEVPEEQLVDISSDSDTLYEEPVVTRTRRIVSIDDLPITPLSPPISVDEDPEIRRAMRFQIFREEGEATLLDSSPRRSFALHDEENLYRQSMPQKLRERCDDGCELTYDARDDPHLWPGWWKLSGEVDEKLAAKVPTQPDSPTDSPRHHHQVSARNFSSSTYQLALIALLIVKDLTGALIDF